MMDPLDPTRTFATFVVGAANQLAAAAARTLSESARPPFNPLYLWGDSGQGKTHLLHAIGAHRRMVDPTAHVVYLEADALALLLEAQTDAGLEPLREAGLLLVDDVDQVTAGRTKLGALLEERVQSGRATVVAARRGPPEWLDGEEVLAQGLGSGLVVEISPPDLALREEILRRRAEFAGVSFARAVVDEVVRMPLGTVQELLGTVNRLIAFQEVSPTPLDPVQTRVLVTGMAPGEPAAGAKSFVTPLDAPDRGEGTGEESDEFGAFLSEIVAGVSDQVDRWRSQVANAILRWEAEGIRCARLQALLDQEVSSQPTAVLRQFEQDVATLQGIRAQLAELAPELEEAEVLRDPDRVTEAAKFLEEARTRGLAAQGPNPNLMVDDLIDVTSNRAAFAAVRQAAELAGPETNPLLLLGGSGTAKTHLLHGYGNLLVARGRRAVVLTGAQAMAAEIEAAGVPGGVMDWRQRYQWAGALLIDDLHLLVGHSAAQEALLGVVEILLEAGRPVAVTSAISPAELAGINPQLLSRVAGGLSVELPAPDREVRRGLVTRLLEATEAAGDAGLIEYLASATGASVRAIHAAVRRVLVAAAGAGLPPSLTLARQALESPGPSASATGGRSGVGRSLGGPKLREKMVERWPEPRQRLIEEMG